MEQQQDQPLEVEYDSESDGDTIINDSESVEIREQLSVYGDSDDEMSGILYPHQLTLTIHLVQEVDGLWTRTVS